MAEDISPRHALPLLHAGQAQKEIFHNEALLQLDALVSPVAQSASIGEPPSSPMPGQCWIVATGASGAWTGKDHVLACWSEGGWRFFAPTPHLVVWVVDEAGQRVWDGSAWQEGVVRADGIHFGGARVLATRQAAINAPSGGTTVDAEARATIATILSTLRAHGLIAL